MGRSHDRGPQEGLQTVYQTEIHFAPEENLENVDIPLINGARKAVDVAVYTFTDRKLADALVTAAGRGVQVRIYRDREQFQSEQNRGGQVSAILFGQPNIQIKVKASRDLMHDKAFEVDNHILRDGSGNWSLSAAHYQDNEIRVTNNPLEVNAFEQIFSAVWSRTDNEVIQ
jgi:phosphatidylserine/phosphatidylglycerophosphate/cardiolipin synthase-like enzyme